MNKVYVPNVNDPRVKKRIKQAYSYAVERFSNKEVMASQSSISKRFGQQQTDLGKWLRKKLLICTDSHYSEAAGISMKYILNKKSAEEVRNIIKVKKPDIIEVVENEYKEQITTGEFIYKEQSDRYWHPIQNMRKGLRTEIFIRNGYKHEYDIEAAAPTLLYQHSLQFGCPQLPNIHKYINNRYQRRKEVSEELMCSEKQAKTIITALFNKANICSNDWSSLFVELNRNKILMYRIQSNEYLKEMRAEIKEMWRHLPVENIRDGTERFAIYFSLEKQVMNEVVKYLKKTKNRHFTQHDGWICEHEIELYRLHSDIKNTTGFSINFSHITYF